MFTLALVFNLLASASLLQAPVQKPVVRLPIVGDSFDQAKSVQELANESDVVLLTRVASKRDVSRASLARTAYTMNVVEVLKVHPSVGAQVVVFRPTGTIEQTDRFVAQYEPQFPDFEERMTYLLFLKWDPKANGFWVTADAAGAAEIRNDGSAHSLNTRHAVGRILNGMALSQVKEQLGRMPK